MAMIGLVGGPCIIIAFALVLFGVIETGSPSQALLSFPEMIWEGALPIYCIWKGFRPSPVTRTLDTREETPTPSMAMA
jgi:hypothetical protein